MRSKNRIFLSVLAVTTAVSLPSWAAEPFGPGNGAVTANVGVVSEYVFRGLAQTDEHFALQAGANYAHDSGLHAGIWGSNVDFDDGDEASLETDLIAGYGGEIKGITWDVGGIYYWYPGADEDLNYDFVELTGTVGHDFKLFKLGFGINYSPEFFLESGDAWFLSTNAEAPIATGLKVMGHLGRQYIDDEGAFGSPDYTEWSVGMGYNFKGFDFSVNYTDTSLDDGTECISGWCDGGVVFGVSRSFE